MTTDIQDSHDQTATALVGGIIDDVQHLVKKQLQLTRQEIIEDFRKAKEATWLYTLGAGAFLVGGVSLCFALAVLLHTLSSSAVTDPASLPLWACHAIVGAIMVVVGGVFTWAGAERCHTINPLGSPATEALKENVEWVAHPK
jgi:hypothetical protein